MKKKYPESMLFKIDTETMKRLSTAAEELGHTRSQFIRESIRQRLLDYERTERETVLTLRHHARPVQPGDDGTGPA